MRRQRRRMNAVQLPSLISWLPDEREQVFITMVLRAQHKNSLRNAAKELRDVLAVLEKTGYAVVPRGLLDAIYNSGKNRHPKRA